MVPIRTVVSSGVTWVHRTRRALLCALGAADSPTLQAQWCKGAE